VIRAFGLVLNILLLLLLLSPYGPIGAAIATSISYIIMFMVSVYMASRYIDLPYKRLLLVSKSDITKLAIDVKVILKNYKFGFGLLSKKKIN
jgi:O-antigen/teichoic acid export membrane protein